jgi:hypothetical protein
VAPEAIGLSDEKDKNSTAVLRNVKTLQLRKYEYLL